MFILRFIDEEDDLAVKEFTSLSSVKEYISQNNLKNMAPNRRSQKSST